MVFVSDVPEDLLESALTLYEDCVRTHIKPNAKGVYACACVKGKMWGRNSIKVHGEIEQFKLHVDKVFQDAKLGELSLRCCHVDVSGDEQCDLLSEIDLLDYHKLRK